jgi:hypothetical protein
MKKPAIISIALIVVLAVVATAYVYRGPIILRVVEYKMPGYISDICECEEVVANLESFSSIIVEKWDFIEKDEKLFILRSIQSIKAARQKAILDGDPGITYEDIEQMVNKAKKISLKYQSS